jgi:hypothetical protein
MDKRVELFVGGGVTSPKQTRLNPMMEQKELWTMIKKPAKFQQIE